MKYINYQDLLSIYSVDPAEHDGLYNIDFGGMVNVLSFVIGVRKTVSLQMTSFVVLCLLQI